MISGNLPSGTRVSKGVVFTAYLIQGKLGALRNLFETGSFQDFGGGMADFSIPLRLGWELDAELRWLKQACRRVKGSQGGFWMVSRGFEHLQVLRVG